MADVTLIATMTGQQYRAAYAVKATKDVWYYLNGVYIPADKATIVATNGHMLYYAVIEAGDVELEDNGLIFEPAKIPASVDSVTIEAFDKTSVLVKTTGTRSGATTQHICKRIEGPFPDYKAIIPSAYRGKAEGPGDAFGFDTGYLAVLKTIFGPRPVRFEMAGPHDSASITGPDGHGTVILMPCRV